MTQPDAIHRTTAKRAPPGPSPQSIVCSLLLGVVAWSGARTSLPLTPEPPPQREFAARPQGRTSDTVQGAARLPPARPVESATESPLDERVLGEWRDHYRGERTLILRSDGTATMIVVLAGFAKKLFAERLTFDIEWSVEDDEITLKTVSGQPEAKFNMIRKVYGDEATYKVLSIDADRMRLGELDGKQEYDWRRLETMYDELANDER